MFQYIVTEYGCNSSPSDMWTPISKVFKDWKLTSISQKFAPRLRIMRYM